MHPFAQHAAESVASLGEIRLISEIRLWLGSACPPAPYGIGDDAAVLAPSSRSQVITVDPVIYQRHFDDTVAPREVGAKLLNRNLSDLAAMGGLPTAAVVSLMLDGRVRLRWLEQFYRGMAASARRHGIAIVGGDIAQAPGTLAASLTVLGHAAGKRLLTRTGAKRGDWIYVTGPLGGSLLGHHARFTPRLKEGAWLASRDEVVSMMDISDGLAKDLGSLTPAGLRPALQSPAIPISRAARRLSRSSGQAPLAHALCDGEDYELLMAVRAKADLAVFESAWRKRFGRSLHCIGRFVPHSALPEPGEIDLSAFHGYEHLR